MFSITHYTKDVFSKINIQKTLKLASCILLCTTSLFSFAVDTELEKETTVFNQTFSWQAMAGFSIDHTQSPLKGVKQEDVFDHISLSLLIDFYYKGFFIQSNHRRSSGVKEGAEIGYQLHVDDNWEVDVLIKSYVPGYNPELLIENKKKNIPSLVGLKEREIGSAIALRYSYYENDSILSVDFANLNYWSAPGGWLVDFYYNDLVIYKNWDIYVGGGITYYSDQVMDYYYGVEASEANNSRNYYNPNDGFKGTFEIYARYPISQKWSFNAGFTQTYYSNVIGRSPLVDKQHISQFLLGVFYVF
jgi:outer membrane scaffolding protein for murein synthesis (MipA/OmpV family)